MSSPRARWAAWAVPALVFLGIFPSQALRLSAAPLMLLLESRLRVSHVLGGLLYSSFFVAYAGAQMPGGMLADRIGSRGAALLGLAVLGTGALGFALAPGYLDAALARFAMGVGASLLYPAMVRFSAHAWPEARRGFLFGILESAQGLGMFVGLGVLPVLAQAWGMVGALGSVTGCLAAAAALLFTTETGEAPRHRGEGLLPPGTGVASLLPLVGVQASGLFIVNGFLAWFPTALRLTWHLSGGGSLAWMASFAASVVASSLLAGRAADRHGRALPLFLGAAAMVAGSLLLLVPLGWLGVGLASFAMGASVGFGITPVVLVVAEFFGTERAGGVTGVVNAVGQAGSALAGVAYGALLQATHGFAAVWLLSTAVAVARGALVCHLVSRLGRARPRP